MQFGNLIDGRGIADRKSTRPDSVFLLEGSGAFSIDAMNISGTVSLPFGWSAEIVE